MKAQVPCAAEPWPERPGAERRAAREARMKAQVPCAAEPWPERPGAERQERVRRG